MNKYIDLLRLKIKGYIIIDDFFPDEICTELREKIYNAEKYNCKYINYNNFLSPLVRCLIPLFLI